MPSMVRHVDEKRKGRRARQARRTEAVPTGLTSRFPIRRGQYRPVCCCRCYSPALQEQASKRATSCELTKWGTFLRGWHFWLLNGEQIRDRRYCLRPFRSSISRLAGQTRPPRPWPISTPKTAVQSLASLIKDRHSCPTPPPALLEDDDALQACTKPTTRISRICCSMMPFVIPASASPLLSRKTLTKLSSELLQPRGPSAPSLARK